MQNIKIYSNSAAPNAEFTSLLQQDLDKRVIKESSLVDAVITKIEDKIILLDLGLKSECTIAKSEFTNEEIENLKVGDKTEIFLERIESKSGEVLASREKAKRFKAWGKIQKAFEDQTKVVGILKNTVKGGWAAECFDIQAFVPSSQLSDAPVKNPSEFIGKPLEFLVVKLDSLRFNVILSRRAILEQTKNITKDEILAKYKVGDVVRAKVKAVMSYGIFCTVDSLDSLCHSSELSHLRVSSPEEMFTIGQEVQAKIIEIDSEQKRMSLSIKALLPDPFIGIENKYKVGEIYEAKVSMLNDWGAFCELDSGLTGLVHNSEILHLNKNVNPKSVFKVGQIIPVKFKELDLEKKKIVLSYKDTQPNPIDEFKKLYPVNSIVDARIVAIKDFGIFCNTGQNPIDIFVHYKQLDYSESSDVIKNYKKGDIIQLKIIDISSENKVNGSCRALKVDPFDFYKDKKKGDVITVTIAEIMETYIKVNAGEKRHSSIIKRSELAIEKSNQKFSRFGVGDKIDVLIVNINFAERKVELSAKKLEEKQTAEAIKKYGKKDSGSQLADILGPALKAEKKPKKSKKEK
jgi:small subunit ribosomal protein S1